MPRNRRKLRQELRDKAEARKAARRDRRLARLAEEERIRAAVARSSNAARFHVVVTRTPFDAVWREVGVLLGLADVRSDLRRRVKRLLAVLDRELPALCVVDQLPWLLLLCGDRWVRAPEEFTAPTRRCGAPDGTVVERRDALARHLMAKWPVPDFLLRALDVRPLGVARVPDEDRWAVAALAAVGQGRSLHDVVRTPVLATPLTRRMCHLFLQAPAHWAPLSALRFAQVVGFGGPEVLACKLESTLLGVYRGDHPVVGEPFWHRVVEWASARPWVAELEPSTLGDVLRWIETEQWAAHARGDRMVLAGRTRDSVMRGVEACGLRRAAAAGPTFPPSGLPAWSEEGWTVVELDSSAALLEEGERQKHCVAMYAPLAGSGKVSLFSLRRGDRRHATLEVVPATGQIVQAKGACNRPCSADELRMVRRWADAAMLGTEALAVRG